MADVTRIFGGPYRPPPAPLSPDPPEAQLAQAMAQAGIDPPSDLQIDGRLHRFSTRSKGIPGASDKSGWYIAFPDNIPAGRFGDWRAGIESQWRATTDREISAAEEMEFARRMREAAMERDRERKRTQTVVADVVAEIWRNAMPASEDHPYLQRKGIDPHGARVVSDGRLIVPVQDIDGNLMSLQYIGADGEKRYHPGGQTGSGLWILGNPEGVIYIAEGFASSATIHQVTGHAVAVAYSASNLPKAAELIRARYGDGMIIVVVADHDEHGVGQKYADQAAQSVGARTALPPIPGMDINDYWLSGHDAAALLQIDRMQQDWLIPADDFAQQPEPIQWLIKRWLQRDALIMVHGPSGGGKTFLLLDMLCTIASGRQEWHGHPVRGRNVVYLAGEGHHGLRSRIAGWRQHHGVQSMSMWLSKGGVDMNTTDGYNKAAQAIIGLQQKPDIIAIDTLHRFLHGDENSAQDAKSMIDACTGLMRQFGCAVVLVHHTGVSEETQHRARGSSAWRGALEIEISIKPTGKSALQVIQRKAKDAELAPDIHLAMHPVQIDGWFDEDGDPVSTVVLVPGDAPEPKAKRPDATTIKYQGWFRDAWTASGRELSEQGTAYVSRSALQEWMRQHAEDVAPAASRPDNSIKKHLNPSESWMVGRLLAGGYLSAYRSGWIIAPGSDWDSEWCVDGILHGSGTPVP